MQLTIPDTSPMGLKQCRDGLFMYNKHDTLIGKSLEAYGEFSGMEADLFRQIVKPGMVAFDIGANIGVQTVGLAKAVGAQGQVVAFEPQRILHQMLCGNLALNGLTNVMALMAALGSKVGSIAVPPVDYAKDGDFGGVALSPDSAGDAKSEVVPLLTIDSFNFPRCDFMKIDVEGMELDVLQGAAQTLARCKPALYIDNDLESQSLPIISFLFKQDYRLYWHLPTLFNPNNFAGNTENIFPDLASINLLCIHSSVPATMTGFVEITRENAAQYVGALG